VHPLRPAVAPLLLQGAAGEAQPGLVEEGAQTVGLGQPQQHRRGVGHVLEAALRLAQLLLGPGAIGDVADDRDAPHHLPLLVAQRPVVTVEETLAAGAADVKGAAAGGALFPGQRPPQALLLAKLHQEGEQLGQVLPQHVGRLHPRERLHGRVPEQAAKIGVEGQQAVAAAGQQLRGQGR
jgi:hypothetical protein